MSEIVLLDTSVYLNVLDVPGRNQQRAEILGAFREKVEKENYFLLPMGTVWETGNHISRLADGGRRREYALKLASEVSRAFNGDLPYRPTYFPEREQFLAWLRDFPDFAQRNKSPDKTTEGVSLTDLSIIKEWERTRHLHPGWRVTIWSLDADMAAYSG